MSWWALLSLAVVVALSVVAWAVIGNGVGHENDALVKTGAAQVALVLQSSALDVQQDLRNLAYFTSESGDSPKVFAEEDKTLLTNPKASVALVDTSGPAPRVVLFSGPAFQSTQLSAPLVAAAVPNSGAITSTVVREGTRSYLVLAARSAAVANLVALTTSPLTTGQVVANNSGPYRNFYIDAYNGSRPRPADLLATTYGPKPLPSPVATSVVHFGRLTWLIEASPKSPPSGAYAAASPWLILGVGLLVALATAAAVEILARRNRYTARLVAERTAELLEAQRTLVRQERLAAVGEMAAVVGHELRNPMAAVLNNLYLARLDLGDRLSSDAEHHLSRAEHQVHVAAQIAEDLTAYTRDRQPRFLDVEFADLVTELLESTPAPEGIAIAVESSATVHVDPILMTQVLGNLLTNAYQAMPEGGTVRLAARSHPVPLITVEDSGAGISVEDVQRLFDPFFTTKVDGTGLGLAIVQRLVEIQGGTVSIENGASGGARISIALPDPGSRPRRQRSSRRAAGVSVAGGSPSDRDDRPGS